MLHSTEIAALGRPPAHMAEADDYHAGFQAALAQSRDTPYRWFAAANTVLYLGGVILAALGLRLFTRTKLDAIDRDLGDAYAYVPEMAIHKKIELTEYLREEYCGTGIDLGAGSGIVGGILKRHAGIERLHGVDIVAQTDFARAQGYDDYTAAGIDDIPLPDGSFDFAISICVLEHVPNLKGAIEETARLLRPGGWFYFSTPSPRFRQNTVPFRALRAIGLRRIAERRACEEDLRALHYHYLSNDQWQQLLEVAGFDRIEIRPLFGAGQCLVYDLLSYSVRLPRFYPCEITARWLARWPRLSRVSSWATAVVGSAVARMHTDESNATHHYVRARRAYP